MSEESKIVDDEGKKDAVPQAASVAEEEDVEGKDQAQGAGGQVAEKKTSKKSKAKKALGRSDDGSAGESSASGKMSANMVKQILEMNPSLKSETAGMDEKQMENKLKSLDISSLLTGMSMGGKNQKDMASYKFWQTQPVVRFDETSKSAEGPIREIDMDEVQKDPPPILDGFEWVTMDLESEDQIQEVYELLTGHYVEDNDAQFRFNYSSSFLSWALRSPGWRKDWHVGVRATKSQRLVAFISAVPVQLRVRAKTLSASEVNFMCIHKKLRSKRLAPILIQEITRRCFLHGVFQAIYTGGVVLPTPVSSCRYYHRSLDWLKLYEVGFSPLPSTTTKARQITRYNLPSKTATPGLRAMQEKDVPAVADLLNRYSERFAMAPTFDHAEIAHWMLKDDNLMEQVVWSYVVEDSSHKITDFVSFYCLESSVIGNQKHDTVRAAYLFYYATETAFQKEEKGLKERLNALINDALILAKTLNFDVFNALTLLDNPLFLEQQKFGPGDGQLHYYLYNYRTPTIPGGIDARNVADPSSRGGVGVVML